MTEAITIPEEQRQPGVLVIALTGLAGSGKDSVASHLVAEHGFRLARFSDPLKRLCCVLFGWDYDRINDLAYKEEKSGHAPVVFTDERVIEIANDQFGPPTGLDRIGVCEHLQARLNAIAPGWTRRRILQWVGTETFREIDPDHWQKKGLSEVERVLSEESARVAIPDTRFANEFDGLRKYFDARVVRTVCPDRQADHGGGHVSEALANEIDADFELVANFGELDLLREQASTLVTRLGAPRIGEPDGWDPQYDVGECLDGGA